MEKRPKHYLLTMFLLIFVVNTFSTVGTAYYYLNIDRCAYYWVDGAAGNNIGGHKYVGSGRILSVFRNCSTVYECREREKHSWKTINGQQDVHCVPEPA